MGIFGFTLVWRQISSKAFPPSAINPPSHLPNALHLVLVQSCCHSAFLLSTPFLSFSSSVHPQLLCLLAPSFPHKLVSYFLTQLVLVLQCYNLILPLNMPFFSNIISPTFNSTSSLSSIGPNFFLLTTSHQFPALASSVLRKRQLRPLPSQCPGRGRSWRHSSPQSPALRRSSPGQHCREGPVLDQPSAGERPQDGQSF